MVAKIILLHAALWFQPNKIQSFEFFVFVLGLLGGEGGEEGVREKKKEGEEGGLKGGRDRVWSSIVQASGHFPTWVMATSNSYTPASASPVLHLEHTCHFLSMMVYTPHLCFDMLRPYYLC